MRKLIPIIVAAVFGLGVGLGSSNVWFRIHTTPYCKLATNADSYHARPVRVKARLIFGTGGMYVYEHCDPVEALASLVEFDSDRPSTAIGYVSELLLSGEKRPIKVADAIIEGEFDAYFSKGCYGPKFHITARKIQLISDLRDLPPTP